MFQVGGDRTGLFLPTLWSDSISCRETGVTIRDRDVEIDYDVEERDG